MHLNNGDEQNNQLGKVNYIDNSDNNLFKPQCMMGAINKLWLVAATAKCMIIVTIVEIHRLIIDVCVSKVIWKYFDQNNVYEIFWIKKTDNHML